MGRAVTAVKAGVWVFETTADLLKKLKLLRKFASSSEKAGRSKIQAGTPDRLKLYSGAKPNWRKVSENQAREALRLRGVPRAAYGPIMSHGRMRSLPIVKELRRRGKLRLSDYKEGARQYPTKALKRARATGERALFKNLKLGSPKIKNYKKGSFEEYEDIAQKMINAQNKLNQIRHRSSSSFLN